MCATVASAGAVAGNRPRDQNRYEQVPKASVFGGVDALFVVRRGVVDPGSAVELFRANPRVLSSCSQWNV